MASLHTCRPMVADLRRAFHAAIYALTALCLSGQGAAVRADESVERGERIFAKQCRKCHELGEGARKRVGPPLTNILNAAAGKVADYRYSAAMRRASEDGLHWTQESLSAFLANPKDFLPKTKMSFRGLDSPGQIDDVIAYLASFSGEEMAAKVDEGFTVSAEVLAIEGDQAYGEYLSSECTTCHQADGDNDGIPSITGWDTEPFVTAMHAYRAKHRDHPVMSMIAGRLSDEEIAGLAAYFAELGE